MAAEIDDPGDWFALDIAQTGRSVAIDCKLGKTRCARDGRADTEARSYARNGETLRAILTMACLTLENTVRMRFGSLGRTRRTHGPSWG